MTRCKPVERGALLLAVVLVVGCLGRSPETRRFVMGEASGEVHAPSSMLSVQVASVNLPDHLRRSEMVWRRSDAELVIDTRHRWAGGLEANVRRVLGVRLGVHLGTSLVSVHPQEPRVPADARVDVDFDELEAVENGRLRARVRWLIRVGGTPVAGTATFEEALVAESATALVRAHEAVLDAVAARIAAQVSGAIAAGAGA